ncbi:hypothetical protein AZ78_3157 [Lysobacter capsici AZ78]|uniref:Uncharacterized protein n=1 Tax=Lysobacter capsici AZ78 TaxID=1444315 RepID=A0A108UAL5_9GAMM|nr:hypothetical protein AZ78_3157 [Lysobacter capsici AZ78]
MPRPAFARTRATRRSALERADMLRASTHMAAAPATIQMRDHEPQSGLRNGSRPRP